MSKLSSLLGSKTIKENLRRHQGTFSAFIKEKGPHRAKEQLLCHTIRPLNQQSKAKEVNGNQEGD